MYPQRAGTCAHQQYAQVPPTQRKYDRIRLTDGRRWFCSDMASRSMRAARGYSAQRRAVESTAAIRRFPATSVLPSPNRSQSIVPWRIELDAF